MKSGRKTSIHLGVSLAVFALSAAALGQENQSEESSETTAEAPKAEPPASSTTTTYVPPWGFPAPGTDVNEGLPSSARPTTDASRSRDTFDLDRPASASATVRGDASGEVILSAGSAVTVPRIHTVKKGDTLWDLCDEYHKNPYEWPRVWSYNPQIQNPHWIYPGDQLRMRPDAGVSDPRGRGMGSSLVTRGKGLVPRDTIYLRNYGYIGDPKRDSWGSLVGAREDQSMLGEGNTVYLMMREGVSPSVGQTLTVFTQGRRPDPVKGARSLSGQIVAIKGTVRIDGFDQKTRLARGRVIESVDVMERGAIIGPVAREFDLVPPVPSRVKLAARVLTGFYPHVHFGREQLVFIDRGADDGLVAGNRLLLLRRGDAWRRTLDIAAGLTAQRMRTDVSEPVRSEDTPLIGKDGDFPVEIVGELRVLRTQKQSSLALVTSSSREIHPGDRAVATQGQ